MKSPCRILVLLACLLPAVASFAEEASEEEALARGFLERGFFDLAEEAFRKLAEKGETEAQRLRGKLGLIDLLRRRAEKEPDPARKKNLFDEATRQYEAFLENSRDPSARYNLAGLLKAKGVDFAHRAEFSHSAEDREPLDREARSAFREAIEQLSACLEAQALRIGTQDLDTAPDAIQELRRNAMFEHADLHLRLGRAWASDPGKKREAVEKAEELFEAFIWDYEVFAIAYLAWIRLGECAVELGKFGVALDRFHNVITMPLPEEPTLSLRRTRDRLRIMAYQGAAHALVRAEKYEEALEKVRALRKAYPDCAAPSSPASLHGRRAFLEEARALKGLGRLKEAVRAVVGVIELDMTSRRYGLNLLERWGVAGQPGIGIEIILLQAEGQVRSGKLSEAIATYMKALEAIGTEDEERTFAARTWGELGAVYMQRTLFYEAGLAYQKGEEVAQRFLEGKSRTLLRDEEMKALWDRAAENAFRAMRAFQKTRKTRSGKKSASEDIEELIRTQRRILTTRYPESPPVENLHFFAARDLLRAGRYLEAVEAFRQVEENSPYRDAALVGIGEAYCRARARRRAESGGKGEGNPEFLKSATTALEAYLHRCSTREGEENAALHACALHFLGKAYAETEAWEKLLSLHEAFEEKYPRRPDLILPSAYHRLRAFLRTGKGRKAEDMVLLMEDAEEALRSERPRGEPNLTLLAAYLKIGAFFGELADGEKKTDPEAARLWTGKSAEYLWRWAEKGCLREEGKKPRASDGATLWAVGARLFLKGDFEKASRCYEAVLSVTPESEKAERLALQRTLGGCLFSMGAWVRALPVFEILHKARPTRKSQGKLAVVHRELGETWEARGNLEKAHPHYDKALGLFAPLLIPREYQKTSWWKRQLSVWRILLKKGRFKLVVRQIDGAIGLDPRLGGPETKPGILVVHEEAKERAGKRVKKPRSSKKKKR